MLKLFKCPVLVAGLLSLLISVALFPDFFTFKRFPLSGSTWETADPAVSDLVVVPSFRTVRYELLTNHNVLWTNLRAHGYPILGNEIQAAPLFPLTLLSYAIPEPYVWNLLIIIRLLLLGIGCFLVARELFGLEVFGAFVFTLAFGFSIFNLRYLNHPWQNGILVGVFYLYFIIRLSDHSQLFFFKRLKFVIILIGIVYALVTSGFPEGALVGGTIAAINALALLFLRFRAGKIKPVFVVDLLIAHAIGFFLSSAQIFALVEFMSFESGGFRTGLGLAQWDKDQSLWSLLSRTTFGPPKGTIIHYFFLGPLFLFLVGFWNRIRCFQFRLKDLGPLLCLLLFILKVCPAVPWFNQLVAALPIFKQSYYVYFFPMVIWGFAYLSGVGADCLFDAKGRQNSQGYALSHWTLIVLFTLVCVMFYQAVKIQSDSVIYCLNEILLFVFFVLACYYFRSGNGSHRRRVLCQCLCGLFLVLEVVNGMPKEYLKYSSKVYAEKFSPERAEVLDRLFSKFSLSKYDLRERSYAGDFTSMGIATMDNGAPAILTPRNASYRELMFQPESEGWAGKTPLREQRFPFSWQLSGVAVYAGKWSPLRVKGDTRTLTLLNDSPTFPVWFDRNFLTRAYLGARCLPAKNSEQANELLRDVRRFGLGDVVVEGLSEEERNWCVQGRFKLERIKIIEDRALKIQIQRVSGPAVMVLSDNFYPGWEAVDLLSGKSLKIRPANLAFRALLLEEKRDYLVEFNYRPAWIGVSLFLLKLGGSLGVLLLIFGAWSWSKRADKGSPAQNLS